MRKINRLIGILVSVSLVFGLLPCMTTKADANSGILRVGDTLYTEQNSRTITIDVKRGSESRVFSRSVAGGTRIGQITGNSTDGYFLTLVDNNGDQIGNAISFGTNGDAHLIGIMYVGTTSDSLLTSYNYCGVWVGVSLNKDSTGLQVGCSETLTATVVTDEGFSNDPVTWTSSDSSCVTVSDAGEITAVAEGIATITAASGGRSAACTVTVDSNITENPSPYNNPMTYDGTDQALVRGGEVVNYGRMEYALSTQANADPSTLSFTLDVVPRATDIGIYYVYYRGVLNGHRSNTRCIQVQITKGNNEVTTPPSAVSGLTYTGYEQDLITPGAAAHGTMQYALATVENPTPQDSAYSVESPKATDEGEYEVYWRVTGDEHYNGLPGGILRVTIGPGDDSGSSSDTSTGTGDNTTPGTDPGNTGGSTNPDPGTGGSSDSTDPITNPDASSDSTPGDNPSTSGGSSAPGSSSGGSSDSTEPEVPSAAATDTTDTGVPQASDSGAAVPAGSGAAVPAGSDASTPAGSGSSATPAGSGSSAAPAQSGSSAAPAQSVGSAAASYTPEQIIRMGVNNFVERLYLNALNRPCDIVGRDSWSDAIINQGATGSEVVRGFINSPEFIGSDVSNEEFVRRLYKVFFNRIPSNSEVANWVNALTSGVSRNEVVNAFIASPEWAAVCAFYRINV